MKFRNTKTGAVMDLPEDFSGSNWEPEEKQAPKETPHRTEATKTTKKKAKEV